MTEIIKWKFGMSIMLTKGELLQLHVLAGEESLGEYIAGVVREHIKKNVHLTGGEAAAFKQLYEGRFDEDGEVSG